MNFQIKSFEFYTRFNWRLKKEITTGFIWLSEDKRIRVEGNEYFLINKAGQKEGIVLKSNPGYKRIKRIIARYFSLYRKGEKGGLAHSSEYWRSKANEGFRNCRKDKSNYLKLAS